MNPLERPPPSEPRMPPPSEPPPVIGRNASGASDQGLNGVEVVCVLAPVVLPICVPLVVPDVVPDVAPVLAKELPSPAIGTPSAGSHFGHFATIGAVSADPRRCSRVIGRIAPTRRAQGNPPAPTPAGGSAASKRWSTRNFGEYAFLEDSRYASQAKNAQRKISHTVATVSSSEMGKSTLSAAHPGHAVVDPPLEFTHGGTPATRAWRRHRYESRNERRPCPVREPGDIGTVVSA